MYQDRLRKIDHQKGLRVAGSLVLALAGCVTNAKVIEYKSPKDGHRTVEVDCGPGPHTASGVVEPFEDGDEVTLAGLRLRLISNTLQLDSAAGLTNIAAVAPESEKNRGLGVAADVNSNARITATRDIEGKKLVFIAICDAATEEEKADVVAANAQLFR